MANNNNINGKSYSYEQIKNRSTLLLVFGFSFLFVGFVAKLFILIVVSVVLLLVGFLYNSYAKTLKNGTSELQPQSESIPKTNSEKENIYNKTSKTSFPIAFIPHEIDGCVYSSRENIEIKNLIAQDLLFEPEMIGHDVDFDCTASDNHTIVSLSYKGAIFAQWDDNYYCHIINETLNDKGRVLIKINSIELADENSREISCIGICLIVYENRTYKWEYYNAAGTSFRQKEIGSLSHLNDDYLISKRDAIDLDMMYKKIYQYVFSPQNVQLIEEPDNEYDPNAIKIVIDNVHIGYIKRDDCLYVKELIERGLIRKVTADIHGGKYKRLVSDYDIVKDKEIYDWEMSETNYFVSIGIKLK